MTPPVLTARHLTKTYGAGENRCDALKGVSLSVEEGESLAIVGKSGSGKSTLMHLLALLDVPDAGVVSVKGQDARSLGRKKLNGLRNRDFGFVFQEFFLTPNSSVLENVVLPLTIAGVRPAERRKRGMDALERLEMADKARNRATDLSGGQKQRVAIARALVNRPSVIFADEPTGNLDSATGSVVEDILFSLNREQGITLIAVTHNADLAARCSRQFCISDGQEVSAAELFSGAVSSAEASRDAFFAAARA